ncbi:sialate:O-sulfotransferase 1-like isoform X1 [Ptychodera flava]|uniref:sialate:O-sulfotransferase 1-like isoform X1 n=1 Tax=Ptychodera flava TaxID=63121 RepID=UPI00396A9EDF
MKKRRKLRCICAVLCFAIVVPVVWLFIYTNHSEEGDRKFKPSVTVVSTSLSKQWQPTKRRVPAPGKRCLISFAESRSRPFIALASFPGSGNTWVRHLLEVATGIYTSSPYNDSVLYKAGFLGEGTNHRDGKTLVAKTHDFFPSQTDFSAAIVLIRNPYHAFIADYNRMAAGHIGFADVHMFRQKGWENYVTFAALAWQKFYINWLGWKNNKIIIYYEDLVNNTLLQVRNMMTFLSLTLEEDRQICYLEMWKGNFTGMEKDLIQEMKHCSLML